MISGQSLRRCVSELRSASAVLFIFSSRMRHTRYWRDWSSGVCSSDLAAGGPRPLSAALARAGLLLVSVCVAAFAVPSLALADDSVPTDWHRAAGLEALLHAPPPENPATICLIDTGVTPTPDLNITARYAYDGGTLDDVRAGPDSPGHGTVVAHFAAAAVNGWGGAGAFPHARISDRKSTRLNSSHANISYAVFCLQKKNTTTLFCF